MMLSEFRLRDTRARGYCTRALLVLLERERGVEVWNDLSLSRLAQFLPDEGMNFVQDFLEWCGYCSVVCCSSWLASSGLLWFTRHLALWMASSHVVGIRLVDQPGAARSLEARELQGRLERRDGSSG